MALMEKPLQADISRLIVDYSGGALVPYRSFFIDDFHGPILEVYNTLHYRTEYIFACRDRDLNGWFWRKMNVGEDLIIAKLPEASLIDLSRPDLSPTPQRLEALIEWYNLCRRDQNLNFKVLSEVAGVPIFPIRGRSIEAEVRVASPIPLDIKALYAEVSKERCFSAGKDISILSNDYRRFYVGISGVDCLEVGKVWRVPRGIFNGIAELGEIFMFVLGSGRKYGLSFLSEAGVDPDQIFFVEHHLEPWKPRFRAENFKWREVKGKRVVILDNAYTGRTLRELACRVLRVGGEPIIVALFPKSRMALWLSGADYLTWHDRLLSINEVYDLLDHDDWHIRLSKRLWR